MMLPMVMMSWGTMLMLMVFFYDSDGDDEDNNAYIVDICILGHGWRW
jgi:hypothetical protein